jgi:hypothetical protein
MSYTNKLPRKFNNPWVYDGNLSARGVRCQALDGNGARCLRRAKFEEFYFTDKETHYGETEWHAVYVCRVHLTPSSIKKLEP